MNEAEFWSQLKNKWPIVHWVRIENSAASGTPDTNFCYNGCDVWAELKMLRGQHVYLEKFQMQFHLSRNMKGGKSLILCRNDETFMVLRLNDPKMLEFGEDIGKFKKFNVQYLQCIIKWNKPFNWVEMFDEFMEKIKCL